MVEEFCPAFGRGLTVVVAVFGAVIAVAAAVSGLNDVIVTMPWVLLFITGCWAIFWNPRVVVAEAGVRLVNVTRTIDVPWPSIIDLETRWALTLVTEHGRFEAWAGPPPSAGGAVRTARRSRRMAVDETETGTAGENISPSSRNAATIVRQRWDQLCADGLLDDSPLAVDSPRIRWHWQIGLVVAVLVVLSIGPLVVR